MTSYDHTQTFGLYCAVLKKGEPSPLLPESDEDQGVGSAPAPGGGGGRGGRGAGPGGAPGEGATPAEAGGAQAEQPAQQPRGPRAPVTVTIDFAGLPQRIISVPGVANRQYSSLKAGVPGTVFYVEAGGGGGGRGGAGGGSVLRRYRLSDRREAQFVDRRRRLRAERRRSQAAVSRGRRRRRGRPRPRRHAAAARRCSWWTPIAIRRRRGRAG